MDSIPDKITVISSSVLRFSAYMFLRWIPGHHFPPLILSSFAIYLVSFVRSFLYTAPYDVVSDEIDIITREVVDSDSEAEEAKEQNGAAAEEPTEELDVDETLVVEERDAAPVKTLLSGLPSPTSLGWTLLTAGINIALVLMTLDVIYRAPYLYQEHDLSFARVGYVSPNSAKILFREPRASELPVRVHYRHADAPLALESGHRLPDTAWKHAESAGGERLSESTDYTTAVEIRRLRPDTRYQYALSNNHTGYFITAPRIGEVSHRNADTFTFLHSSCIKPRVPYTPFQHPLHVPGFKYLAKWIPQLKAHFMLFLGDFIYVDVPHRHGFDAESYRREYRQVYASPDWPSVSANLPWLHVLDDHEIANDWDGNTSAPYPAAADPWDHYHVAANPPSTRQGESYFSFAQGPAEFFLLDTRRYRSPEALGNSTSANKTMLGAQQLSDLLRFLRHPTPPGVRWKVVVSSVPFTKNWRVGTPDTWGGYLHERQIVLEAMWDVGTRGGVGVVILSGDRHEFAATAFPPPKDGGRGEWPSSATVHEFSTSPLNMFWLPYRTYKQTDGEDVLIKYIPDGNSKFGAVEIQSLPKSEQSTLRYRVFVEGEEVWSYLITTPPEGKRGLWE